jgi:hypothetical protein
VSGFSRTRKVSAVRQLAVRLKPDTTEAENESRIVVEIAADLFSRSWKVRNGSMTTEAMTSASLATARQSVVLPLPLLPVDEDQRFAAEDRSADGREVRRRVVGVPVGVGADQRPSR